MAEAPNPQGLLVVAYYFPPDFAVGSFRIAKFCKYLLRRGLRIHVLTARSSTPTNLTMAEEVAGARRVEFGTTGRTHPWVWTLLLFFRLPWALLRCGEAVLATGSPFGPLVCCAFWSRVFGRPFVADFRDPWALHPQYVPNPQSLKARVKRGMEAFVVGSATKVLVVTETMRSLYVEAYPAAADRIVLIPNGFDPEDAPRPARAAEASRSDSDQRGRPPIRLTHCGKVGSIRDPQPIMEALSMSEELRARVRLSFVGPREAPVLEAAERFGVLDCVEFMGRVPYHDALRAIAASEAGLILGTYQPWEPTTKIYDYMLQRRAVLALTCEDGEIARTLEIYGAGRVTAANGADLAADILEFVEALPLLAEDARHADVEPFSRRAQADRLYEVLQEAGFSG